MIFCGTVRGLCQKELTSPKKGNESGLTVFARGKKHPRESALFKGAAGKEESV